MAYTPLGRHGEANFNGREEAAAAAALHPPSPPLTQKQKFVVLLKKIVCFSERRMLSLYHACALRTWSLPMPLRAALQML